MDHSLPEPAPQRVPAQAAYAVVLHQAAAEQVALGLVRAWAPIVPAAVLSTLRVADDHGGRRAWEEVASRLGQAGLGPSRLVLAGIGDAQNMALQLAFGPAAVGCAGVLACGNVLLPLAALAGQPMRGSAEAAAGLDGGRPAVQRGGPGRPAALLSECRPGRAGSCAAQDGPPAHGGGGRSRLRSAAGPPGQRLPCRVGRGGARRGAKDPRRAVPTPAGA